MATDIPFSRKKSNDTIELLDWTNGISIERIKEEIAREAAELIAACKNRLKQQP